MANVTPDSMFHNMVIATILNLTKKFLGFLYIYRYIPNEEKSFTDKEA